MFLCFREIQYTVFANIYYPEMFFYQYILPWNVNVILMKFCHSLHWKFIFILTTPNAVMKMSSVWQFHFSVCLQEIQHTIRAHHLCSSCLVAEIFAIVSTIKAIKPGPDMASWLPITASHKPINPGNHFTNGEWAHISDLVKIHDIFTWKQWSDQFTILLMPQQLSCHDMCKIVT